MSYARWSDGDVYVFGTTGGSFICMCCRFTPMKLCHPSALFDGLGKFSMHDDFTCESEQKMLEHLEKHRDEGDLVPEHAFERLKEEIEKDE